MQHYKSSSEWSGIHRLWVGLTLLAFVTVTCLLGRFGSPNAWPIRLDVNLEEVKRPETGSSATSGRLFSGDIVRAFHGKVQFGLSSGGGDDGPDDARIDTANLGFNTTDCEHWAVVTTIFEPSAAVKDMIERNAEGWCTVIVADRKSPTTYSIDSNHMVVYLSADTQAIMRQDNDFLSSIPWNHFGRKNIGFLFSIQHGAKFVWDFDDDNVLLAGKSPLLPVSAAGDVEVMIPQNHSSAVFNPYPAMGAPHRPSWPRGQPLETIQMASTFATPLRKARIKASHIGVVQSLANHDPDMDAIYRLTMPTPFDFNSHSPSRQLPVMVPKGVRTPFNAQACLWTQNSFWGMLLPITVHGRVSDIWRSYFAQRLMDDIGQVVVFQPPAVIQERNAHSYLADLDAEHQLYAQSGKLVEFLGAWKGAATSMPGRIEELVIAVFERGYIELDDVLLTQKWLHALVAVGYQFPPLAN